MSTHPVIDLDVVTAGRAVVDLYPLQDGRATKDVKSFGQFLGGSPTNVAVAAARLGLRSAIVTRTGDDIFHDFVVGELEHFGVETRWVREAPQTRTTLAVCELLRPEEPRLQFYRDLVPPELAITAEDLCAAASAAEILWITASGFEADPSAAAHSAALTHASRVVLDLDYRPGFWNSDTQLRSRLNSVLGSVQTVIGNERECAIALGAEGSAEDLALALLERGPELVVVKRGSRGAIAVTRREIVRQSAAPIDVVNGLGAGDAFGGGLLKGLLARWPLSVTLRYAATAGAIVAGRRGCSIAMPSPEDVSAALPHTPK